MFNWLKLLIRWIVEPSPWYIHKNCGGDIKTLYNGEWMCEKCYELDLKYEDVESVERGSR